MDMTPQTWPEWYDGRHINEVLFCQQFLEKHPMKCVRGRLFTVDGLIEDEGQIGNLILEEISGVLTANLSKTVANLLASIKLQAYSPPLPIETDRIHVANGTYFMDGSFTACCLPPRGKKCSCSSARAARAKAASVWSCAPCWATA